MIQVVCLHDIGWELNLGLPQCRSIWFSPWVEKIPWRREWQPTPVVLSGESHGQRSLAGYSPWACKELGHNRTTNTFTKVGRDLGWGSGL